MFFWLSKILAVLLEPVFHSMILLGLGLLLRKIVTMRKKGIYATRHGGSFLTKLASFMIGFGILLPVFYSFVPPAQMIMRTIEGPQTALDWPMPDHLDGIIILGGHAEGAAIATTRKQGQLNGAAERFIAGLSLATYYQDVPVVFSGMSGQLNHRGWSEADSIRNLLSQMQISSDSIFFEETSRNSYENAVETKTLLQPTPDGQYLLVTSASHMPRSLATFRAAGWPEMLAYRVDYLSPTTGASHLFHASTGFAIWRRIYHETIGMMVYLATGRATLKDG